MGTDSGIDEKIKQLMTGIFKLDVSLLGATITPQTVGSWDSLAHITLMLALEREFKIRIPDEQVVSLASFTEIAETLNRLVHERAAAEKTPAPESALRHR